MAGESVLSDPAVAEWDVSGVIGPQKERWQKNDTLCRPMGGKTMVLLVVLETDQGVWGKKNHSKFIFGSHSYIFLDAYIPYGEICQAVGFLGLVFETMICVRDTGDRTVNAGDKHSHKEQGRS